MRVKTPDWCKDVKIPHPEFKYIFTIDLKGRIVEEVLNRDGMNYEEERNVNLDNPGIYLLKMQKSTIRSYIDPYLLEHATPFRWIFSNTNANKLLEEALRVFKASIKCGGCVNATECGRDYQEFYNKVQQDLANGRFHFYSEGSELEEFRIGGIEVKVFRSGALSILLRFKWEEEISVDKCLNLVRYPEDIVIEPGKCHFGALNMLARCVCHQVFKTFKGDLFKQARDKISNVYSSLLKRKNEKEYITFEDILTKIDETFNPHVYVGVFCPDIFSGGIPNLPTDGKQRVIIALANTTPEFTEKFEDALQYIKEYNVARGEEIIVLERRSWIIVSKRLQEKEAGRRYRVGLVETFLYSLETILATTFSIETFNENLEEEVKKISYKFNAGIERFYAGGFWSKVRRILSALQLPWMGEVLENLRDFIATLSKARSISPCEDITTSMEAHLKSTTAIKVVKATKRNFSLNELISLARERMANYTRFLITGYDIITTETQRIQSWLLLILTGVLVLLTINQISSVILNIWQGH